MKNPAFDIDNWREIGATLAQNKTRTFMTAFGIFWGTAILAILLGGAGGFRGFMMHQFDGLATNMAVIQSSRTTKSYRGFNKGSSWNLQSADAGNIRRAISDIDALSVVNFLSADATYGQHKSSTTLMGLEPDFAKIMTPVIYSGRFINESDESQGRKVCVIGQRVANELFGTLQPEGQSIGINGIYYTVVGVAGQSSEISIAGQIDDSVIIPNSTMRRAYNLGENVDIIYLTTRSGTRPADYESRIRSIIIRNHPIAPDDTGALWFMDVSEQFSMIDNVFIGIDLLALFVGLGTLLSGIIGIGNIMWIIVRERTQEIGIRRAIGARPRDIIIQILSEGVLMTLVAGLAGITFAAIILAVTQSVVIVDGDTIPFQLKFATAIAILFTFLILGSLAGLIPAVKAMRIKPIEALNSK